MSLSLERHELRKELMAVIAAGRELSPDHDAVLADVFLDYMHRRYAPQPTGARLGDSVRRLGPLIAAACLALAALAFPFLLFHGSDTRPAYRTPFVQRPLYPYWWYDRDDRWPNGNGRPGSVQFP